MKRLLYLMKQPLRVIEAHFAFVKSGLHRLACPHLRVNAPGNRPRFFKLDPRDGFVMQRIPIVLGQSSPTFLLGAHVAAPVSRPTLIQPWLRWSKAS